MHDSDCSTNNRGVPELLGPCDCGVQVSQGGEAVAWRVVGVHPKHRHPHRVVEYTEKTAEGQAAHWRNRGCTVEVTPLYTHPADQVANVDPDKLAQFIRQIDGDNRMGAAALAERICEWLAKP